jgi:hypothetical protein
MTLRFLLVVVAMMVCANAQAQSDERMVLGPHEATCGSWTEARKQKSTARFRELHIWALGYVSGINMRDRRDFLAHIDADAISAWLDNYCQKHPLSNFAKTVDTLALELKQRKDE